MKTNATGTNSMNMKLNPIHLVPHARTAALLVFCALNALTLHAQQRADILPLPTSGNVTLSLDEYTRLITLAARPVKKPDGAPLNYAIQHADLKLHVTSDSVVGSVELDGETYTRNASKVGLTTGMTILDARQDGKFLPLALDNGMITAVLPGSANFAVALDAGLPLGIEAGRASFAIPVPSAGSARLSLMVLGDHTNVRLAPGLIIDRS